MLSFYFLNVEHGDSIIVQYESEEGLFYGVIDSNRIDKSSPPPALSKLNSLNAKSLSFVALTHPHGDHYNGLSEVMEAYDNKIDNFYSFPISGVVPERLKKLAELYKTVHSKTPSKTLKGQLFEFVKILQLAKDNIGLENWMEPSGFMNRITPNGFKDVELYIILPNPIAKSKYFSMIETGNIEVAGGKDLNKHSMAFYIKYKGHNIILGGDCNLEDWLSHRYFCEKGGVTLDGNIFKLPHHGSNKNCEQRVLAHVFGNNESKYALISANGHSHPHPQVLNRIEKMGINPYCTNRSMKCGGKIKEYKEIAEVDPVLGRQLSLLAIPSSDDITPCQGDIEISIDTTGTLSIASQYPHPCHLRGDFDFLIPQEPTA